MSLRRPTRTAPEAFTALDAEYARPDGVARLTWWLGLAVLGLAIVVLRYKASLYSSSDYSIFFVDWYRHLADHGFRESFRHAFASYNMPYLYLLWLGSALHLGARVTIKGIANGFDLVTALAIYRLVRGFVGRRAGGVAAVVFLLLPSVWFNSAVWGQVDAMYTCFLLLSLESVLRRRQHRAWWWFGVAFAMKMQAIFLLPWLALAWALNRRRRWSAPLLASVAPVMSLLPAAACGMSRADLVSAYYGQATSRTFLDKAPGFWMLSSGGGSIEVISQACYAVTLTMLAAYAVALVQRHGWAGDPRRMVSSAAAIALLMPFFMPSMRNRYFYLAQVLVLVLAFVDARRWWLAVVFETTMFITYPLNLLHVPAPLGPHFWVLPVLLVLVVLVRDSLGLAAPAASSRAPQPAAQGGDAHQRPQGKARDDALLQRPGGEQQADGDHRGRQPAGGVDEVAVQREHEGAQQGEHRDQ